MVTRGINKYHAGNIRSSYYAHNIQNYKSGLRSRSRSRPESVILTGVGVGVGKFSSTPTPVRSRSRLRDFFIISFLVKMETELETEYYVLTADIHDGLSYTVLLSLGLRLFPGELAFNHTSRLDTYNQQRLSLWGPVTSLCLINFGNRVTGRKNHSSTVMFCAVKVIDRDEGRGTVRCFQYTFNYY